LCKYLVGYSEAWCDIFGYRETSGTEVPCFSASLNIYIVYVVKC